MAGTRAKQNQISVPENKDFNLPLLPELDNIILSYCDMSDYGDQKLNQGEPKEKHPSYADQRQLSFFGDLKAQVAAKMAHQVLRANPPAVLALAKQNPLLVEVVVIAEDPHGNKVQGNPLQIAMMTGDYNFREREEKEEDHGLVEQLSVALNLDKEIIIATHKKAFPPGWEEEMEQRMRPIRAAFYKFAKLMKNASPADIQIMLQQYRDKITPKSVEEFRAALIPDSKKIITTGYIVDPAILAEAHHYFEKNVDHFDGWYSDKSDLYFVYGIGSLQRFTLSICDLQVIRSGLYYAIDKDNKTKVKRDLTGGGDLISRLGLEVYINVFGGGGGTNWAQGTIGGGAAGRGSDIYHNLFRAKTSAQQNLCSESNRELTRSRNV